LTGFTTKEHIAQSQTAMPIRILFFWLLSFSSMASAEKFTFERPLMGTRFTVVCYAEDRSAAAKAAKAAFARGEEINQLASDYLPGSELSLLSTKPINTPIPLTPLLYEMLDHSRKMAESTNGAFDPTLGPLTKLWRSTRDSGRLPDAETLHAAKDVSGWRYFTLNPQSCSITLLRKNMAFDLGGIAKGFAADLMLDTMVVAGFPHTMITAGGDIRLGDPPPDREGWNVAVQTFDLSKPDEVITLSNAAVSTSGDLHQSVKIDDVSYSHILDPATGLGLTRRIAVTVIADDAKRSDPLATAACVQGIDGIPALQKLPGVRTVKPRVLQDSAPPLRSDKTRE
jgi:thiamine biosynthesis lipoprotein